MGTMTALSVAALVASILDVALTFRIFRLGYEEEINRLMKWAVKRQPVAAYALGLIMTAGACVIGIVLVGAVRWRGAPACGWAWLGVVALVRAGSVALNYRTWRRLVCWRRPGP